MVTIGFTSNKKCALFFRKAELMLLHFFGETSGQSRFGKYCIYDGGSMEKENYSAASSGSSKKVYPFESQGGGKAPSGSTWVSCEFIKMLFIANDTEFGLSQFFHLESKLATVPSYFINRNQVRLVIADP